MTLRDYIEKMPHLPVEDDKTEALASTSVDHDAVSVTTTPFRCRLTVEELAGFNPAIGVIWPGSLVQGKSLRGGNLAGINVKRSPGTLVLSTLGDPHSRSAGTITRRSVRVAEPSAATVETERSKLIAQGLTFADKVGQTFRQFYSLDHALMQIGASASYLGNNLRAQLNSDSYRSQSNVMATFSQEFYSVAMELPTSPTSYFDSSVTVDDLRPYSNIEDNPITFVQSVTYGRLGLLMASSTSTYDELTRSLKACMSHALGHANANYDNSLQRIVESSDVRLLMFGGSTDKSLQLIASTHEALAAMNTWISQPVKKETLELGLPISYRVAYLRDNQPARITFVTSYDRVEKSPIPRYTDWKITFNTADDDKDDDTSLIVELRDGNGNVVATLSTIGKEFKNGSENTFSLTQNHTLYARDAKDLRLRIRIDPNGDDTWDFAYTLTASDSGGGPNFYKSGHMRLTERSREAIE